MCRYLIVLVFLFSTVTPNLIDDLITELEDIIKATNSTCNTKLGKLSKGLKERQLWAVEMVDATAKLQSGILRGNIINFGDYDECLSVNSGEDDANERVVGQYCLGQLNPPQNKLGQELGNQKVAQSPASYMFPSYFGVCTPSDCNASELTQLLDKYLKVYQSYLYIPNLTLVDTLCYSEDTVHPKLTNGAIITIIVFATILLCTSIMTAYDVFLRYNGREPSHSILVSFSLYTNAKKLMTATDNKQQLLECLHGLRVISMMWVVLGHTYAAFPLFGGVVSNVKDLIEWKDKPTTMYVVGGTLSVDTFFVMGGTVLTYTYMKSMSKGIKMNVPLFYLHRWLRLTPALIMTMLVSSTVLPYIVSGPQYFKAHAFDKNCEDYWWTSILYIQNYYNPEAMCIAQSWYLSVDFQLFFISPVFLLPLSRWPKQTLVAIVAAAAGSIGYCYYVAVEYKLGALLINVFGDGNFMMKYYLKTHTRAAPWLIGLILGYAIYVLKQRKTGIRINKITVAALWISSITVLFVCAFVRSDTLVSSEYDKWGNVLHITFVRPAWAIALCWIILASVFGYGGVVNQFLGSAFFQIVGRLTYSQYLVHMTLIYALAFTKRVPLYFSDLEMMHMFWGNYMFSLGLALIWTLLFESPVIVIEKSLFGSESTKKVTSNKVSAA